MISTVPLHVEGLHFSYGTNQVLRGLDLEVEQGEMLGLVGPNGSGKSTLLSIIAGVLPPQRGKVFSDGTSLQRLKPRQRAKLVAMVPQNPAVPQGFTVLEVVLMGRNPHLGLLQWEGREDLEVARRVMEQTDTWDLAHRLLSSLSGGERQRVFMARALAQETLLLLLDEPTAHLDIGYQPAVLDLIQKIRRDSKVTVVAAMHDLSLAAQYCTRIAALHQGAIHMVGEPADVMTPEVVATVFGAEVSVVHHPVHGTPVVLPISRL